MINACCLVDPLGLIDLTQEEEYQEINKFISKIFKRIEESVSFEPDVFPHELIKGKKADIYIFDYGGLGCGCEDTINHLYRSLIQAIQDRPNVLFIIYSAFSATHWFEPIVKEELGEDAKFPNIIIYDDYEKLDEILEWFR